MELLRTSLRDFRSHERLELDLGPRVTVLAGSNGAGKTNILEAIHFGCTGRSCRTSSDRQVIRHGAPVARVETLVEDGEIRHSLVVALERGGAKQMEVDGARVDRIAASPHRPLVTVFLPDRLSLMTGPPGNRRAHVDQLVSALLLADLIEQCVEQPNLCMTLDQPI